MRIGIGIRIDSKKKTVEEPEFIILTDDEGRILVDEDDEIIIYG